VRSTVSSRRLVVGALVAALAPAVAFAVLVVGVPGAGAVPAGAAAPLTTGPPTPGPTGSATPVTPGTSPFPPGAPSNLTATAVTTGSVTLSWTAAPRGCCAVVAYDITYTQAFNDIVWSTQVGNVTTATITGNISRAKQYSFYVSARDDMGRRGPSSNSAQVVTPNADTGDTTPPERPGVFSVSGQTGTTASLAWAESTDDVGVVAYDVYRFDGLYISTLLASVTGTSVTVPLRAGPNLLYLRARDAAGNVSLATNVQNVQGATSPPVTPGTCQVTYASQSEWSTGFVATVTIRNTSTSAVINGWTLAFAFRGDQRVTQSWNARVIQSGTLVTAEHSGWNSAIPPGGSVSFGLYGTWRTSNAPPTAFTLNGNSCVVAA